MEQQRIWKRPKPVLLWVLTALAGIFLVLQLCYLWKIFPWLLQYTLVGKPTNGAFLPVLCNLLCAFFTLAPTALLLCSLLYRIRKGNTTRAAALWFYIPYFLCVLALPLCKHLYTWETQSLNHVFAAYENYARATMLFGAILCIAALLCAGALVWLLRNSASRASKIALSVCALLFLAAADFTGQAVSLPYYLLSSIQPNLHAITFFGWLFTLPQGILLVLYIITIRPENHVQIYAEATA